MASKKISELIAAGALTGAELVELVQGGVNKQSTTQDIADLGGGGGAVDSVNGQTGVVVLDAGDIANTPSGNISATDLQTAINELDAELALKLSITDFAKYIYDQVSTSTAGGTITLDLNSQIKRSFVGSATFSASKAIALSNTTNTLEWIFHFEVTNVAATITPPTDWYFSSPNWNGTLWTPPTTGIYIMGGFFDDTNNRWIITISSVNTN